MMTFHFGIASDRTNVQPLVATPILSPCTKFCRAKEIQILLGRKGIRMCGTFAWPLNPSVKLPVVVGSTIQTCLAKTSFCGKGVVHFCSAQFRPNPGLLSMMVSGHGMLIRSNGKVYRKRDPQSRKQGRQKLDPQGGPCPNVLHHYLLWSKSGIPTFSAGCIMT